MSEKTRQIDRQLAELLGSMFASIIELQQAHSKLARIQTSNSKLFVALLKDDKKAAAVELGEVIKKTDEYLDVLEKLANDLNGSVRALRDYLGVTA